MAGYLYLAAKAGTKAATTRPLDDLLVADFDESGDCIGIEILSPAHVTRQHLLAAATAIGVTVDPRELEPLPTAA